MRQLALSVLLALAPLAAYADALEGKKSPAEIMADAAPSEWRTFDQENLLYIDLASGTAIVALADVLAQGHVRQVKTLVRQGFYDGLSFYRVIDGFVAQGGDPFEARDIGEAAAHMDAEFEEPVSLIEDRYVLARDADGYASQVGFLNGLPIGIDDARETAWHLHCAGAFAFGRNDDRNSASTEFYIPLQPQRYLDRNLSVFGRVISGMEHVQRLRRNVPPTSEDDDVGDEIIAMHIGSDLPPARQMQLEILRTNSDAFAEYWESRRNRPGSFFHFRHDYIDICQLPMPIREKIVADTAE